MFIFLSRKLCVVFYFAKHSCLFVRELQTLQDEITRLEVEQNQYIGQVITPHIQRAVECVR